MKFTLTYDGELRANGSPKDKWAIRKQLHPQLEELWQVNPVLRRVWDHREWPKGGSFATDLHHSERLPEYTPLEQQQMAMFRPATIDLCAPIEKGGYQFLPLVRETFLLTCGLTVLFLRKEPPGRVYQGGDLDNRLKTLFDALAMPAHPEQVVSDPTAPRPMYTLLEDDSSITKIDIETDRLLSRPDASANEVRLVIEVEVKVAQARHYNQPFLGG